MNLYKKTSKMANEQPGDGKRLYTNLFKTFKHDYNYISSADVKLELKSSDTVRNQDIKNVDVINIDSPKTTSFDDISTSDVVYLPDNYFKDNLGADLNLFIKSFNNLAISHVPQIPIYGN